MYWGWRRRRSLHLDRNITVNDLRLRRIEYASGYICKNL
jgi:hypothetical protein